MKTGAMALFLILVGIFYLIPFLRLGHLGLRKLLFLKPYTYPAREAVKGPLSLLRFLAGVEYVIAPWRFYLVGIPVVIWFFISVSLLIAGGRMPEGGTFFLWLLFFLLVLAAASAGRRTKLRAAEFFRCFPRAHPDVFYDRFKMELAFGGVDFFTTENVRELLPGEADFRKNERPRQRLMILVKGVLDTAYLAHICLTALRLMGPRYVFDVFDTVAAMWGKRMLQLCQGRFVLKGAENLNGKSGRFLLIFNHKSSFDFVLSFFALSEINIDHRGVRPRFILAQDHFKDNRLIYNIFAIGRVCEAVHMVFIARKDRKKSFENLKTAARFILEKDIDVAIYPQGTRARGTYDRALRRRDAGYYTTIRKRDIGQPLPHIKKGTAYLIWDTLEELKNFSARKDLHLVFIGMRGTGVVLPKGQLKVQTESEVTFNIGPVTTLTPDVIDKLIAEKGHEDQDLHRKAFVSDMCQLIDDRLKTLLGHNEMLAQRYLTELKGQFRFDAQKIEAIRAALTEYEKEGDVVFKILDFIYSLPIAQWNGLLSELSQLLLERSDGARLELLLKEVSEEFLKKK